MKTLKQSVLATYDYQQTKKLCLDYPTVFDCDWELWRDKARADFGISRRFFDLVTTLPGYERYLQISSYFGINKDCVTEINPSGEIEGVYEPYLGANISINQGNKDMYLFYSSLLNPQQSLLLKEKLKERLNLILLGETRLTRQTSKDIYLFRQLLERGYPSVVKEAIELMDVDFATYGYLYPSLVASGDREAISYFAPKYFNLPSNFILERDVPLTKTWEQVPQINLPPALLYRRHFTPEISILLVNTIRIGYVQLADLIDKLYQIRGRRLEALSSLEFPVYKFTDPEGSVAIFHRYQLLDAWKGNLLMAELWSYSLQREEQDFPNYFPTGVAGNIAFILSLINFAQIRKVISKAKIRKEIYPLTCIIKDELSSNFPSM